MSKRWLVVLSIAAVFLVAVTPMASASSGGTERPFKASFEGPVHWEFPGDFPSGCDEVTTVTESPGLATHMGKVTISSSHCPAEPDRLDDGVATIRAANGDALFMVYDYDPSDETNTIPVTFDGGTGRFEGATGEAMWEYYVVPEFVDGCDDPDPSNCLDFTVPWQWGSTLIGHVDY